MKKILLIALAIIGFGAMNSDAQVRVVRKTTVVRDNDQYTRDYRHQGNPHYYGRHDNGLHRGWYKNHDRMQRRDWDRDRDRVIERRRVDQYYERR